METTERRTYKVGDWIICDMEIRVIKEIEDGRITTLSTGWMESGFWDYSDRIFPLTMHNKVVAESFKNKYDELYRESKGKNLNWPDIRRWFEDRCDKALRLPETEDAFKPVWEELNQFCQEFRGQLKSVSDALIAGFPLFRR